MELRLLLKTWMDIPFYTRLLGLVGLFLIFSFLTYLVNRINLFLSQRTPFKEKSLKYRAINLYIFLISALTGSLGFALGPLLVAFPYNLQYLIAMTLTGLWGLSLVYSMWTFQPDTPKVLVSEVSYLRRLLEFPVVFFKTLHDLIDRLIRAALAPHQDPWGLFIGLSLLLLLPYGFVSNEEFSKIICLTLGGMGLTLSLCESLTNFFKYSFFPEPMANKQRLYQLTLGAIGFFLGTVFSESIFLPTLQDYYLLLGLIAGFFTGASAGIPLSRIWFYYQLLHRERERQKQAEKSEGERWLMRLTRLLEDCRKLALLAPSLPELETKFQSLKSEFTSSMKSFRSLREQALQLENQLKELIRSAQRIQAGPEGEVAQPSEEGRSFSSFQAGGVRPSWESDTAQPGMGERPGQPTDVEQKTPLSPEELLRSIEQVMTETRKLIGELKAKNTGGGSILTNALALEARVNGLKRKLEGRRISLAIALADAIKFKEAAEMLTYYLVSTESAEEIKPLTDKECREILNVGPEASKEEIKRAYRELAKLYHPDKFATSAPEIKEKADNAFKRINKAYQILMRDVE